VQSQEIVRGTEPLPPVLCGIRSFLRPGLNKPLHWKPLLFELLLLLQLPWQSQCYLEVEGVQLRHAAELSMLRFLTSGPLLTLNNFLQSWRGLRGFALFTNILLLALTITILQFTSTILLNDVQRGILLGQLTFSNQPSSLVRLYGTLTNYFTVKPGTFAYFLEYSEPATQQNCVADTGISVRRFLPVSTRVKERTFYHTKD
jgi:hypothetical protein